MSPPPQVLLPYHCDMAAGGTLTPVSVPDEAKPDQPCRRHSLACSSQNIITVSLQLQKSPNITSTSSIITTIIVIIIIKGSSMSVNQVSA